MLYLITGANGAGKTLNTLKWIRERAVKEGRPVCHNGRFEVVEGGELANWRQIDIKDWQAEPDGTIFLVDECHNDFPLRAPSSQPPEYVRMLAEHRRRGFDFYMVTQHPQNIDSFVRRLIGSPGWHRHLKRAFGGDLVSVCEWPAVNPNCEKSGSGKTGTVTMQPFPKEVYGWYRSASLHTGKKKLPRAVWVLLACLLLIPLLGWFAVSGVKSGATKKDLAKPAQAAPVGPVDAPSKPSGLYVAAETAADYIGARTARLPDFPHSAPVYDEVTRPKVAPYPAACVEMGKVCKCYSQQATVLHISVSVCLQIVRHGFFVDWQDGHQEQPDKRARLIDAPQAQVQQPRQDKPAQVVQSVPLPEPRPQQPGQITQADIPHVLAMRRPSMAAYAPQ